MRLLWKKKNGLVELNYHKILTSDVKKELQYLTYLWHILYKYIQV
jgi:hypothetical protein